MEERRATFTAREANALMDIRLDKAAEEIGYATGMLVMALLAKPPKPDDPTTHAPVFRRLKFVRDVVAGRSGKVGAGAFIEAVRFMLESKLGND